MAYSAKVRAKRALRTGAYDGHVRAALVEIAHERRPKHRPAKLDAVLRQAARMLSLERAARILARARQRDVEDAD